MSLRFFRHDRNTPVEPGGEPPLLNLRQAFILSAALTIAAAVGILTSLATASTPKAFLAAIAACISALRLLNAIIS